MESAISQFSYLPATKSERETFVNMCVEEVLSGSRNPLELEVILKNLEETVNKIRKHPAVIEAVMIETDLYKEKSFTAFGSSITKTNRTTYNFTNCNDSVYDQLISDLDSIKEKVKERENFLKTIKPGNSIANVETGEEIYPPQTSTTEFLTIKLNK